MGLACCVARGDKTPTHGTNGETMHRYAVYSPSWSCRWENQRRIAGEVENASCEVSHGIGTNSSMDIKGEFVLDRGNISGWRSPLLNTGTPTALKSPVNKITSSEITRAGSDDTRVDFSKDQPDIVDSFSSELSLSIPSSSSCLTSYAKLLSSQTRPRSMNSTLSRKAHRSPGHQFWRQVSDSRILGSRSPDSKLVSEIRPSSVLSTCSNDVMVRSQDNSSDSWSKLAFSELVASSQRERWSFDSEFLGSGRSKLSESSSTFSCSPPIDLQTCGVCSKLLKEKSSWSIQKIIASSDLSVVAVLVCGHVYHSECLEAMTQEVDRYDPPCPICMVGKEKLSKMSRKILRAEVELKSRSKVCGHRVIDICEEDGSSVFYREKSAGQEEKISNMGPSTSAKKPFLRRHLSLGSRWGRSMSENNSRKGFWSRYHKD